MSFSHGGAYIFLGKRVVHSDYCGESCTLPQMLYMLFPLTSPLPSLWIRLRWWKGRLLCGEALLVGMFVTNYSRVIELVLLSPIHCVPVNGSMNVFERLFFFLSASHSRMNCGKDVWLVVVSWSLPRRHTRPPQHPYGFCIGVANAKDVWYACLFFWWHCPESRDRKNGINQCSASGKISLHFDPP